MFESALDGTPAFSGGFVPPGDILHTGHPGLTIIVPTRNESGNVEPLLDRIAAAAGTRSIEVLFVDDSDDDTPEQVRVRAVGATVPVRLLHRGRVSAAAGSGVRWSPGCGRRAAPGRW